MKVLLVPEAQDEFLDALDYYTQAGASLGRRFKEETTRCIVSGAPVWMKGMPASPMAASVRLENSLISGAMLWKASSME